MTSNLKSGSNAMHCRFVGMLTVWLCCMVLGLASAHAQVVTADMVGSVTDATGAVVPNASVTVRNTGTNEVHTVKSSDSGEWTITLLPVGNYSVAIEASGFKKYSVVSMALSGGDRARVTAKMEVGQVSETVEVTTQAAALQSDNSTLGTTVTGAAIQDLPLNGRNFVSLATLAPGATQGGPNAMSGGSRPDDRRQSSAISVNGQNETLNSYLIDGMDNNGRYIGSIAVRPSVDAMQEFRIETSLYTADVTKTAGGVINIITKSGSNRIHGTVFEFLRNDLFDTNGNYNFAGGTPLPKGKYRQNQFGASIGGPIRHDKTFFFGDYEALRIVQGVAFTDRIVPTAAQRGGLYPSTLPILDAARCPSTPVTPQQLADNTDCNNVRTGNTPANQAAYAASFAKLQFPGNQIPTARIDSTVRNLLALFPNPTNPAATGTTNFQTNVGRTQFQHTFDVRIDHHFTDKNTLFARYSFNDTATFTPNAFPAANGILGGGCNCGTGNGQTTVPTGSFSGNAKQRAQNIQINDSHVITPRLVLAGRVSYVRQALQSLPDNATSAANAATTLGIPGVNTGLLRTSGLPQITLAPYASLGDQLFLPELVYENTYQGNTDLHYTRGAHNVAAGFTFIRRHIYLNQSQQARGFWAFNSTAPSGYKIGTGDTFAAFLLDLPVTFSRSIQLVSFGSTGSEIGSFIQDDWRVTPNLTINAGVRWDIFTPFSETHGYQASWSVAQSKLLIPGQPGVDSRSNVKTDYTDIAPRVGFAATLHPGLVLRGGFGISYYNGLISQAPYLQNVPFTFSTTLNCGNNTVACPTLVQGAPVPPTSVDLNLANNGNITGTITGLAPNLKLPYIEQFSLNLQKDFHGTVFGVAYVGTVGRRQIVAINQNLGVDPPLSSASTANVPRPLTAAGVFTNPTTGVKNSPNVNVSQNLASSNYNALQFTAVRRTSHGLTLNANYGFAKSLGNAGSTQSIAGNGGLQWLSHFTTYDYGRTGLDVRHRVAVQVNYQIPFANGLTGPVGYVLKQWQLNTVYQYSNGIPFTVLNPSGRMNISGGGADRPNVNGPITYPKTVQRWFNPAALSLNTVGTPGTEQAYMFQGPPNRTWDLSASKIFPLTERFRLQFRTEGFNVLNNANFQNPNATIPSGTFDPNTSATWGPLGTISALASAPRQFQFALKLEF